MHVMVVDSSSFETEAAERQFFGVVCGLARTIQLSCNTVKSYRMVVVLDHRKQNDPSSLSKRVPWLLPCGMKCMTYNTIIIIIIIIEKDGKRWTLHNHWPFKFINREAFADACRETPNVRSGIIYKWWI
jgi:hypothetical protein